MPAIPAAPAPDEPNRLAALHELRILDTLPEQVYEDIVLLASQLCATPISLVSLVDTDRQWFKAKVGLGVDETHRDLAFCAHAIVSSEPVFVVEDTALDPRFADSALVTGEPRIRFYAGAPIVVPGGQAMGTVCVIDTVPRRLDAAQAGTLQALARQVAALFELRQRTLDSERQARAVEQLSQQAASERRHSAELLEIVLRGGNLGLWDLHVPSGTFTINDREYEMLGYSPRDVGADALAWRTLVHPDDWPVLNAAMAPHLKGETAFYECEHRMHHRAGHWVWVLNRAVVVERDATGAPLRMVGTHMDTTERRRTEAALQVSEERLSLALSSSRLAVFDWDIAADRIHRGANLSMMRGGPAQAIDCTGTEVEALIHPDDVPGVRAAMRSMLRGDVPNYDFEHRIRRLDGAWIWIRGVGRVAERGPDGRVLRASGTDEDVTERKVAAQALLDSQRRLRLITDNLPALVAYIDRDERYRFLNAYVGAMFRLDTQAVLGRTMREVRGETTYAALAPHVAQVLRGQANSFSYADQVAGGAYRYQSNYVPDVDAAGVVQGFYAMTFDITELHETQRQLEQLARVDALTGLPNRRQFDDRIAESMGRSRRTRRPMAVMFLDIDHFKVINDTLGHAGGDAVLCEFARRLTQCVRTTDMVARLAGDEFVVLLEGIDGAVELDPLAAKIVACIRPRFQVGETALDVTTSVGVALYEGGAHSAAEVLDLADGALYQAKRRGRNCYAVA